MIHGGIVSAHYGGVNSKNPISYYYGKNQTERVGQNYAPGGLGNDKAAEFKTTADETYDSGKADMLTITNATNENDIDLTNGPNNAVLQFPAGRYHLLLQGYSEAQYQTAFRIELRQIQEGTDDLIITHTPGYSGGQTPARTAYQLLWYDFVTDGTEKFYFRFPSGGGSPRSHFLRIETIT